MSDIQNVVKNIQNIMRKDAGVDGDAQRLSQLVWMLYLKIFDDQEKGLEYDDPSYRSQLPEELRWRNWAANSEGMTGEDLSKFIDTELFPALKKLSVRGHKESSTIIRSVFADTYNYMRSGTLIRQVINKINEIDFNKQGDRHQFGDVYEKLLKDLQGAGNAGEFYTPRPLTKFIVDAVSPKLGESVLDPACGTGGFLTNTLEYVRENSQVKTQEDEEILQDSVKGVELKPLPYILATTNLILHDVENPAMLRRDDMLAAKALTEYGSKDQVDVVVANPPFGGVVADGVEKNFPAKYRTKATELLFLVLIIRILKDGGRAGLVLPDGTLFSEGVATEIKKHLLETCNLHTIVRLPQGVFNPYAGVNTNLLFFTKGEPTKEVWYYHMQLPEGMKQYTKGNPIKHHEFDAVRDWWKNREENKFAHKIEIEQIKERNYNLDFKNPNGEELVDQLSSKELKEKILDYEKTIQDLIKIL